VLSAIMLCLSMVNVVMMVVIVLSIIMLYLSMANVFILIGIVQSDILLHLCRLLVRDYSDYINC